MLSGTLLRRLGGQDFTTLLNEPMLQWVDYEQAKNRSSKRRQVAGRPGCRVNSRTCTSKEAINIPLYFIRLKLNADRQSRELRCAAYDRAQFGWRLHPERARLRRARAQGVAGRNRCGETRRG